MRGGYKVSMTRRKKKLLEPMSIRLDADVKAALEGFAEDEDRSLSSYVNRVLRDHVERVEAKKHGDVQKQEARQETKKRPPERS
jgi:predicted transcriptional regulator